ncbi:MAG: hypothetical protein ACJ744_00910 [Gaiellaceae bacterium]|jgi:hypothetical protein
MKRTMLGFAAAAIAACAFIGGALADTGKTVAQVVGAVRIDPTDPSVGYVLTRYSCQPGAPGSTAAAHLFVSVKQTADASADPALTTEGGGFGHLAAAWSQSHPTDQVVCDGKVHVQTFTVHQGLDEDSGEATGYGELARGWGYVQFCLFGGDGTYAASQIFQRVQ